MFVLSLFGNYCGDGIGNDGGVFFVAIACLFVCVVMIYNDEGAFIIVVAVFVCLRSSFQFENH